MKKNNDLSRAVWTQSPPACLRRRSYALMRLFLLGCLFAMTQGAWADNFMQNKSNYTAMISGIDKVIFTLPTQYDGSINEGVQEGYVYVQVGDAPSTTLFEWHLPSYGDLTSDQESGTVQITAKQEGTFQLKGKTKGGYKTFTQNSGTIEYTLAPNDDDDDHFSSTIEWTVPRAYRGKKLKFYLWAHVNHRGAGDWHIPSATERYLMLDWDCPAAGQASISLNEPMIAFDAGKVNMIMFPYSVIANKIHWMKIHYTDAVTKQKYEHTISSSNTADFAYIPADRPWTDVYLEASLTDMEGQKVDDTVESVHMSSGMLHHPKSLTAMVNSSGQMVLSWRVDNADQHDLMDADMFEVQRNLTGSTDPDDPYWLTIDMTQQFHLNQSVYTIIDKDLLNAYTGNHVSYRIRRSSTSIWMWQPGAGHVSYTLPSLFRLPAITNGTVQRGTWSDDLHQVMFSYEKKSPNIDEKGRFIVRNAEEYEEFKQLVADRKMSYENAVFLISNQEDWERVAGVVSSVWSKLNVVLVNDVDLTDCDKMIGSEGSPFTGTFEGNGHTLTLFYKTTQEYTAPFRYIGNATIRNLRTVGNIETSSKFAAGLVSYISSGENVIERCESEVVINSTLNGDATNGGLVANFRQGDLTMRDCSFNGMLTGDKCHSNGGLIGWIESDAKAKLYNCLFAPSVISTQRDGCKTFARGRDLNYSLRLNNCYFTKVYGEAGQDGKACMVISTNDDWLKFKEAVRAAGGNKEVNAVLENDLTVIHSIGYADEVPYYGYFNGCGHTLNVNIDGGSDSFIAPFARAKSSTIKNLRVTGTVKGGIHSSGLIGSSTVTNTVTNVRVSATIITNNQYAGGFIGNGSSSNITLTNCLFDGTIRSSRSDALYAGAFIGWEAGGTSNVITNCLENGTLSNFAHAGMNYAYNNGNTTCYGNNGSNKNNYSYHNWGEVGTGYNNAGSLGAATLQTKLGNGWTVENNQVVPVLTKIVLDDGYGISGAEKTAEQLCASLGANWQADNSYANPVMDIDSEAFDYILWDNRAKLKLRINMHGERGVESQIVDLTANEDAIKKQTFSHELSRKCVEYSFDLLLLRGTSPCKIFGTESDTLVIPITKLDKGDLANYRFQNADRISKFTAKKKQSSVELSWTTTGGDHDFFQILRRNHSNQANAEWTDTIATNLEQLFFEDKTVLVQQAYDYRIQSVWQCEGQQITYADTLGVECEATGRVSGYIRMADGTAIAGVKVTCSPGSGVSDADAEYTCITDEAGFFEFKDLPYKLSGKYYIDVEGSGYTGPNSEGEVIFNQSSNWKQNFNFYMDKYYIYSGNVFYRDTSIPVPGVSFKLDGKVMHDASQQVITTNTQGAFSLSIPSGAHRVQAVKDGHYFAFDGYLKNEDAREGEDNTLFNFKKNVSGVYLWDSTTVVLRGRVVGGDIQGSKPLGESMSVNNLGDSLKIVMQLEGDNASYLIRKQDDETVKSASYQVMFGKENKDTTQVYVTRHTLTIKPDKKTGEYQLELHPAKYKVIEVSAQGYATLFQSGKVGETVDLAFNVQGDTCEYNRIYHTEPTLNIKQFNPSGEDYFGVKSMTANDILGNHADVNIYSYKKISDNDSIGIYSFGYPVFMAGSPYGFAMQACEKYYWNNNSGSTVDIVNLNGGKVSIKNYLIGDEWDKTKLATTVELDKEGIGSYIFTPQNTTYVLEGKNALKTVDITLEYDGSYYDIKPFNGDLLRGYVMATVAKNEGRKSIVSGTPKLFDILRDPPGGGSSAYIEAGSKLSYGYSMDLNGTVGLNFKLQKGENMNWYSGAVIAANTGTGKTDGTFVSSSKSDVLSLTPQVNFGKSWNYNYNVDITERIQTSSSKKWIGPKADLFIGMTDNVIVQDAIAVRVIPQSQYDIMTLHQGGTYTTKDGVSIKVPVGTSKVLATGKDANGENVYLVRDEVISASPSVQSTFIHSQQFIENELLPDLIKLRNSLLLPKSTSEAQAMELANTKGVPTYVSDVEPNEDYYGFKYTVYWPNKAKATYVDYLTDSFETGDSINALNQQVATWLEFLYRNEEEKLSVMPSNLVKRYDFDGGASSIQYSETFTTGESGSQYLRYPLLNGLGDLGNSVTGLIGVYVENFLKFKKLNKGEITNKENTVGQNNENGQTQVSLKFQGFTLDLKINVNASINWNDKFNFSSSNSKKIGFTLSAASKSSLTVDVYRTVANVRVIPKGSDATPYYDLTYKALDKWGKLSLTSSPLNYMEDTTLVYSSFVYRTIGGVTCQPYEDQRLTRWYQKGTVIDVATIPADKPNIWIDQPVVSGVPFDEPARFTLHMANETDYPERSTMIFNYSLPADCNPNGATICVDGKPLSSTGESIVLYPAIGSDGKHTVFTKEITVYPSKAFDYENLAISLMDPEDAARVFTQKFSAHFIPTAGKVNISVPSDKWVINTESPYDGKRQQWYMPVRIDGFDVNWPNFDHIELQYKLSTQGDKDWVNVCSYYADKDLRAKASGVTDTIPGNGTILAPFYGEADPIEQYYDIRAVTYCRYAGGYLTGSSEVLTGIKDTRLPIAFGTPEPTDGILGIGDDIKIQFSEPIAANYLRNINNFEVLGRLNSDDISTSTSLSFDEESLAVTQGSRNLSGKPFTVDMMINPAIDKRDMTIFLHGGEDKGLRYGITADRRLMAVVNGQTVTSDSIVMFNNDLHEVAYVLNPTDDGITLKFFDGSKEIGSKIISGAYEASSPIILGYDPYNSDHSFKGDMLELRLWNRAMTSNQLDNYGKKRLTGFEGGLLDYYPMNEGEGEWCYDKAAGSMDLAMIGTSWKRPSGISLTMKGDKGLRMSPDKFLRTTDHDYTLMFWFQTTDATSTIFSNGEALRGQDDQINIGVENNELYVRSSGFEKKDIGFVSDGGWHHFAMTVSRSQNVANVYLDKKLYESFAADSLSGISSDHIALGATYKDKNTVVNPMKGHIDEVGMFSSVLPTNLIKEYSNHTPIGTMSALMAYLDFGRSQKMDNNTQHLEPTGISIKRYVDNQGKVLARQDTLVAQADVEALAARDSYAPMVSNAQMDNLNYSFAANNNELYINVTEPDFMVEKTNIYVTVKDVPDLQGNLMASPITMNLYVYRTPLRWDVKRIEKDLNYGSGMTYTATIKNLSGTTQHFSLDDLPIWITASQTQGTINALDEQKITFTVSDYINIGTYNEQVTLICDNGMAETLPMTLRVRGDEPEWSVSDELKQQNQTMMMVARVKIDGIVANSTEDILAVFDENQQVLGKAHIEVNNKAAANEALAYLTIYGYTKRGESPKLYFRFFQAASGSVYSVHPTDSSSIFFQKDAIVGSASQPVNLENSFDFVQTMKLKKGWNWVSFNVRPKRYYNEDGEFIGNVTVGDFLNGMSKWEVGDRIRSVNGTDVQQYTCREDLTSANGYRWEDEDKPVNIDNRQMYSIYSMSDKTVYLEGTYLYEEITVHKDWNRIGYLATINLPIAQALSDYTDDASEGDVVKSQSEFAIATKISSGSSSNIVWKGSLQFMEAGKGYMLKRKADSEVKFAYPLYYSDNRYSSTEETQYAPRRCSVNTLNTMNIVAAVDGIETEEGDRLVVFSGVERVAEAEADNEQNYYLNIGSDSKDNEPLTFAIERDGETIAMTSSRISYVPNQVLGTPNEPTAINFTSLEEMPHDGKWYTVSGIMMEKKPTTSGLYIYNGQVVFIK